MHYPDSAVCPLRGDDLELTILMPCQNEARTVEACAKAARGFLENPHHDRQILFERHVRLGVTFSSDDERTFRGAARKQSIERSLRGGDREVVRPICYGLGIHGHIR